MDRRKFLTWVGVGALASSLPVAIAACQPESPQADTEAEEPTASTASAGGERDDGAVVIGTVDELDSQGYVESNPSFADGSVIVVRDPNNADTLYAVDSFCTHQGCSVEWDADATGFICPCHQSAFAPDGSVTSGPATDPLETFTAQIDGSDVIIQPA